MYLVTAAYLLILLLSVALLYDQIAKRIPTRLDSNQAPKSRFELVPVGDDVGVDGSLTRANGIDIVFVHGLGSNPDTTWRAARPTETADAPGGRVPDSERFVNWVSDFLPDDLPPTIRKDVRMFFYNYDSYWKRDAVYTRLANLGSGLLEHISGKIRVSEPERSRNLIFVAHSYGGLVVKQALVQAQANRDLGHVTEHIKAIFFLGTPHRGSSFGAWGWWIAQVLQPLGSNPLILANLEYDSTSLLDLHRTFVGAARNNLRVFNFFEQRPTDIFRLRSIQWQQFCVPEQSATYEGPKVRNIGLPVDHYGLNKFGSRSESYQLILSKLVEVAEPFSRSVKRHYAVPFERVHTYTERAELSKELEEKLQIRHENASIPYAVAVHGLGGAGKSQLALNYAEKHKDRYNPILWIDATDEETVRSTFKTCAAELGLPVEDAQKEGSVLTDGVVQAVLRWLRQRIEADDEWLVIIDNADDLGWGIQRIMPKGNQGSAIITSRDYKSIRLIPGACESVCVSVMSKREGEALLLQHLGLDAESASEGIRHDCNEVAQRLEYLALAIDLAGAYISSDSAPEQALPRYLADYDRHRDELLQMDAFRGLLPTQTTVWTVWDTTLEKITKEYPDLQPELLLILLAQFKGSIVQDELFRLASTGMEVIDDMLEEEADARIPADLRKFFQLDNGEWDSFRYRQSRDVLVRYSLLQRVEGQWPGVTMHSLVQWRAMLSDKSRPWHQWSTICILAACVQVIEREGEPEFRRHLVVHLPDISENQCEGRWRHENFVELVLARIYDDEGRLEEAEKLYAGMMETYKTKLGPDHPDTLSCMSKLASTYMCQGRLGDAEKLEVEVMEASKTKLGTDHSDTLEYMANLALTYSRQGRWEEAEKLLLEAMETRKTKLGADHLDIVVFKSRLASTFWNQGRLEEAKRLEIEALEISMTQLGADHPETLRSFADLVPTYLSLGEWQMAEKLGVDVWEVSKTKLGADHPSTLTAMSNVAFAWKFQGRHADAVALLENCYQARQRVLGLRHPDTIQSLAALESWR